MSPETQVLGERPVGAAHQLFFLQAATLHPPTDRRNLVFLRVVGGTGKGQFSRGDVERLHHPVFDQWECLERLCRRSYVNNQIGITTNRLKYPVTVLYGDRNFMSRFDELASKRADRQCIHLMIRYRNPAGREHVH